MEKLRSSLNAERRTVREKENTILEEKRKLRQQEAENLRLKLEVKQLTREVKVLRKQNESKDRVSLRVFFDKLKKKHLSDR